MILKIKSNIATSENGFIFNPATGDSFLGNSIASEILMLMKNGEATNEIKKNLLQKYEVSPEQLERDWEDWMLQLKEANLIEF